MTAETVLWPLLIAAVCGTVALAYQKRFRLYWTVLCIWGLALGITALFGAGVAYGEMRAARAAAEWVASSGDKLAASRLLLASWDDRIGHSILISATGGLCALFALFVPIPYIVKLVEGAERKRPTHDREDG